MSESELNLAYIKSQATFPFLNYRTDKQEFMFAELYWLYLFKAIVNENADGAWVARYPPDRDGNPLFSVINWKMARAFRVIHLHSQMEEEEIKEGKHYPVGIWCDEDSNEKIGFKYYPNDEMLYELTLCCDISAESEVAARKFIQLFCVDQISIERLNKEIMEYE